MKISKLIVLIFVILVVVLCIHIFLPKPMEKKECDVIITTFPINVTASNKVLCLDRNFELDLGEGEAAISIINSTNITLDCFGHSSTLLKGPPWNIWLRVKNSSDILVKDCTVINFTVSIEVNRPEWEEEALKSTGITIQGNKFEFDGLSAVTVITVLEFHRANAVRIFNNSFFKAGAVIYEGWGHEVKGNIFNNDSLLGVGGDVAITDNLIISSRLIVGGSNVTIIGNNMNLSGLLLDVHKSLRMLNNSIEIHPISPTSISIFYFPSDEETLVDESNSLNGKYISVFGTRDKKCPPPYFNFSNYSALGLNNCSNISLENLELISLTGTNLRDLKIINSTFLILQIQNSTTLEIRNSTFVGELSLQQVQSSSLIANIGNLTLINGSWNKMYNNSFNCPFLTITITGKGNELHNNLINCSYIEIKTENSSLYRNVFLFPEKIKEFKELGILIQGYNNTFHENFFKGAVSVFGENNTFYGNYFEKKIWSYCRAENNWNTTIGNYWGNWSDECKDIDRNGICDEPFSENCVVDYRPLSRYYPHLYISS